jgi:hypothetical protein
MRLILTALLLVCLVPLPQLPSTDSQAAAVETTPVYPPVRSNPAASQRPRASGPARFVEARRGDDTAAGSEEKPWRSVKHALGQLQPGETLYLREGAYYENVYLSLAGTADKPITLRSFPGEQAILDGGLREFFESPESAWQPVVGGGPDEYRSSRPYPNVRTLIGSFGDSMVGLQTYEFAKDLRSTNELFDWEDWDRQNETDLKPVYCGPGLWYDRQTGYIHARFTATHLPEPVTNYRGSNDPRKIPLVLAPYNSVTLHIDKGEHIKLQDLVIRGGGYTTIVLDYATNLEFDNCTIWCGTYGIRATRTGPLKMIGSAMYGNLAPWTSRGDASKRDYPGRPHRNISRMNTHSLIEIEAGGESSVYATPQNDHWEFAYNDFGDGHDGLYFGGINVKFHNNLVENLQDDGIYLSPMYRRYRLDKTDPEIQIYQNLFRGMLTALAYGGSEPTTEDRVVIYRNVFDLRQPVYTGRPSTRNPKANTNAGQPMGDHGSPPWAAMNIYHNTYIVAEQARDASFGTAGAPAIGRPRRVFNNLYLHLARLPGFIPPDTDKDAVLDGNLYWAPGVEAKQADTLFAKYRGSELFARSKPLYAAGSSSHCVVMDPKLLHFQRDNLRQSDVRLQAESPAIDAGVELPSEWPDPVRSLDQGKPDIGAMSKEAPEFRAGRAARP